MTVLLDATALLLLLNEKTSPPKHPDSNEPIADAHERIEYAVNKIRERGEQIIIAAPVFAELLVRAENAASPYVDAFNRSPHFKPVPFDQKAAILHSEYTRKALAAGERLDESKCKVKFDRQIVAIAKAEGADTIYTYDDRLAKHAEMQGLKVVRTHEIVMEKQGELFSQETAAPNGHAAPNSELKPEPPLQPKAEAENTKGEGIVEIPPPPLKPNSPIKPVEIRTLVE